MLKLTDSVMKKGLSLFLISVIALFASGCGTSKKADAAIQDVFSVEQMVQNYEKNADGIQNVVEFASSCLNDHCGLQLVLNQSGISMFYVYNFTWLGTDNPKQNDLDTLMPLVGLTQEELDSIISKLRNVNCLSVELMKSGSQFAKVLYWENKACGYYYHLYYEPLSESELTTNAKEMIYCIPYSNKMFLEYNPRNNDADAVFPEREVYMKSLGLSK